MGFCKKVGFEKVVARGLLLRRWYRLLIFKKLVYDYLINVGLGKFRFIIVKTRVSY